VVVAEIGAVITRPAAIVATWRTLSRLVSVQRRRDRDLVGAQGERRPQRSPRSAVLPPLPPRKSLRSELKLLCATIDLRAQLPIKHRAHAQVAGRCLPAVDDPGRHA
jgi:hypothetical protein